MASHDLDARLQRCEDVVEYVRDEADNNAVLDRCTADIRHVLDLEKELRRSCELTSTRLTKHTQRLQQAFRDTQDEFGKIDTKMLSRKARSLDQAKFDNLAALILGREGSLDRLRGISQAHRDALLNSEKEQLEKNLRDDIAGLYRVIEDEKALASKNGRLLSESEKSVRDKDLKISSLEKANLELQSDISGLENTRDAAEAKAMSFEQSLGKAEATIAELEREIRRLREDVTSKDATVANLNRQVESLTSLYDTGRARAEVQDQELSKLKANCSQSEHDISELRKIQHGLASFFATQAGFAFSQEDLGTWTSFIGQLQHAGWVRGLESERPWTMLPLQARHLRPDPTVTPAGLVEMLTRLYSVPLSEGDGLPTQLLHLLTQQIGIANMLPLGGIVVVLDRLLSALEPTTLERDRTLQLLAFGLLQAVRCTRGRLNQQDDALEALFLRVEALVTRCGPSILRLAELVNDDGTQLVRDLLATRDDQGDPVPDPPFQYLFSPGTRLGLVKPLPDWRAFVWVLSVDDRTIRGVLCEHGGWDGTATLYRITSPGEQNDVVLDCHHFADKAWLLRNMRQRELEP
ncbi:hypothetical protein F4818DRAFT_416837 [Hypoxylon cercidicola]|nr:hypothetical protein F4818DRAFT_416837 [Hypoxylon cercidicola]